MGGEHTYFTNLWKQLFYTCFFKCQLLRIIVDFKVQIWYAAFYLLDSYNNFISQKIAVEKHKGISNESEPSSNN